MNVSELERRIQELETQLHDAKATIAALECEIESGEPENRRRLLREAYKKIADLERRLAHGG